MPYKLVRTEAFEEDLLSVLEYLFEHSGTDSIKRLMDEIDRKTELLGFNPFIFAISRKAGLRNHEFREVFARSYTIVLNYQPEKTSLACLSCELTTLPMYRWVNMLILRMCKTVLISIVVPCFNEENTIDNFIEALSKITNDSKAWAQATSESPAIGTKPVSQLTPPPPNFELILVNDGSSDSTLGKIKAIADNCPPGSCRWISFSRNFGKEAALLAGMQNARGDLVAIMDADLQDPPTLLPQMYEKIISGQCDVVATKRTDRTGEPPVRSFFARKFYRIINRISDVEIVDGARDFRLMSRQVVDAVLKLSERNRFSKGLFSWVGFRTEWISYPNIERSADKSSWSFSSLIKYAMDGITAFSSAPLIIASGIGLLLCLIALIAVLFIVIRVLLFDDPVSGWPSLACIIIFLGGIQLFCLGIVGQYLAKVYNETKHRPHYVIQESNLSAENPKSISE